MVARALRLTAITLALLVTVSMADAYVLSEIGEQDWSAHNQPVAGLAAFNLAQSGEPWPVGWYGSDLGQNADIVWLHAFTPPDPGHSVILEFGLFDIDSGTYPIGGVRDVVAGFWLDGLPQDDTFFIAAGPSDHSTAGIYSLIVPPALVADGSLGVRLLLTGPGLLGAAPGVNDGYTDYNGAGLDFARLTAEPGAPDIGLSVCSAAVKWLSPRPGLGKIRFQAAFDADMPGPEDVVAVYFDGVELVAAPFADFHQDSPSEPYLFTDKGLVVRLDFAEGLLFVVTPNVALGDLDPSDGVDVELWLGDACGEENIPMAEVAGARLVYQHPGCECGAM